MACLLLNGAAWSQAWSLSDQQRRDYLGYYSPIIFKNADEDPGKHAGYDWVTSFDFDRDGIYANNKENWEQIGAFAAAGGNGAAGDGHDRSHWRIRPTLYTALIEFMEQDRKSLVLLYHIYHAKQRGSIHDWERVEIRVDGVTGRPGSGAEAVNYAVLTQHSMHNRRLAERQPLNFMETRFGKHVMIWQAPWSGWIPPNKAELRWVEDTFEVLDRDNRGNGKARTAISGSPAHRAVNYVFLCDCDPEAAAYWEARNITGATASAMAAGTAGEVDWAAVPRATYELQDIADILPSHAGGNRSDLHWKGSATTILLESPIRGEDGAELVPAGRQAFFAGAVDVEDRRERRSGYPRKHWFWGTYKTGRRGAFTSKAFASGLPAGSGGRSALRGEASGHPEAHGRYWWQHDYFLHDGRAGDASAAGESGYWLPGAWYSAAQGGFDGRWVQLFPDDPGGATLAARPLAAAGLSAAFGALAVNGLPLQATEPQ